MPKTLSPGCWKCPLWLDCLAMPPAPPIWVLAPLACMEPADASNAPAPAVAAAEAVEVVAAAELALNSIPAEGVGNSSSTASPVTESRE